jgi:hypothetical protein
MTAITHYGTISVNPYMESEHSAWARYYRTFYPLSCKSNYRRHLRFQSNPLLVLLQARGERSLQNLRIDFKKLLDDTK